MSTETSTKTQNISDGSELIPAEVEARARRQESEPPNEPSAKENQQEVSTDKPNSTSGYTVSRQGLVNNYPVTPKMEVQEDAVTGTGLRRFALIALVLVVLGMVVPIVVSL